MDIAVVGRHTKVSEEFREHVLEKLSRVESLDPRATRVEVHVVHERNPKLTDERERVELTVHSKGPVIRAEAAAADRVDALDAAAFKLLERLRRQHERFAHRHQVKGTVRTMPADVPPVETPADVAPAPAVEVRDVASWEGEPDGHTREIPVAGTPIVIRSKTHEATPMTIGDAIDQMELVGHDFFLFHDADSGLPSAVYRRRGWTYGVIHLDAAPAAPSSIDADAGDQGLRETA